MFVGGPNSRTDFHVEQGAELFLQLRGCMQLPTIQAGKLKVVSTPAGHLFAGKLKVVSIPAGHLFVLPGRVPHSPQRPEEGSLGMVIERER
ncbi:3-hydroxyanthranilic acid dioxygenase, partial [Baffinella frigidus]